ncbi:MAG: hypothetical protein QOF89_1464 [Acidobacteriota bacterium]|nr:hypothetical protein [Acidobacteriota bacterium]
MRANLLLPVLLLSIPLASCSSGASSHSPAAVPEAPPAEVKTESLTPLDHAPLLRAMAATYLTPEEPVLGIQIGDDLRAYPLRILDWHAVANDTVGGVPVALAWCRSCGSAVLYRRDTPKGTLTLAASGVFRDGDQLLRDKETGTLWKQLTGTPVEGSLAGSGVELQPLPVVLTTWGNWLRVHPETRVLSLETGARSEYPAGGRPGTEPDTPSIFGLVVNGMAKAYPLDLVVKAGVVNDEIAGRPVLITWEPGADAKNRTLRAYDRGDRTFARSERAFLGAVFLSDQNGRVWRVGEDALTTPDGKKLARLPGYLSSRDGWTAAHPGTLVLSEPK